MYRERKKNICSRQSTNLIQVQWSTDTSQSAVEARRRELLGARDRLSQKEETEDNSAAKQETLNIPQGTNPIPVLSKYFKTEPEEDDAVNQMKALVAKHQWSETTLLKYVFAALFTDADMRTDFYKKARILSFVCPLLFALPSHLSHLSHLIKHRISSVFFYF